MTEQTLSKTVSIHATIDGDFGSRVALEDDATNRVVKVDWKKDDDFKIKVNGTDYTFTYTDNKKFECSDPNFPTTFTEGGFVIATYPGTTPVGYSTQPGTLEGAASLLTMTAMLNVNAGQSTENLDLVSSIVKLTLINNDFKGKEMTQVSLNAGSSAVVAVTETFTRTTTDGSIVAYLVIPEMVLNMKAITIHAVCGEENYFASLSNKSLETGKLYNVNKKMDKMGEIGSITDPAQAKKGDYAMLDGTFIPKGTLLTDTQKAFVRGIVFWTTDDSNTSGQTPAKLTDDKIMAADFPNCNHGLIVSLKEVAGNLAWQYVDNPDE